MELPESLTNSIEQLRRLPGVGEKSAIRYALDILRWQPNDLEQFANTISKLSQIKKCQRCNMYSDENVCSICSNVKRKETKILCVVETISDLIAIEKSNNFFGSYFVLNGVLNPLMGIGPEELKLEKLVDIIKSESVENVVLAVNPSVEGDATCSYLNSLLPSNVVVERIGFGIPMGGSLEYLDSLTIKKALENRRKF